MSTRFRNWRLVTSDDENHYFDCVVPVGQCWRCHYTKMRTGRPVRNFEMVPPPEPDPVADLYQITTYGNIPTEERPVQS